MPVREIEGAAGFLFEAGMLKRARRAGWWIAGVRDPESIAEHSFRAALTGMVLAAMEGADPARTSMLCLLHDIQETRVGDIPHIGRHYVTAADNEAVTRDQVADCPAQVADTVSEAVAEYETGDTLEAVCARDADKLECLVQAVEYRAQGVTTVQPWIDSCHAALKTESGRAVAEAALNANPLDWQKTRREDR
ncbi:MAG: HD domain-containing protein [Stackebrandtia sp.]